MSGVVSTKFDSMIARGKLDDCIAFLEDGLRCCVAQRKRHLEQLDKLIADGLLTKLSREVHEKQMAAARK